MQPVAPSVERRRIAVCACTFHRPTGLRHLLDSLAAMEVDTATLDVVVVIVDNDPEGSGGAVVEAARATFPFELRYVIESERGIPAARSTAVATAGEVDALAFVDDDEWVSRRWLTELVAVQRRTAAGVVTATIKPVFDVEPPRWVIDGAFFERPRFRTGEKINYARTSNVLIGAEVLASAGSPPFRPISAVGGDDTHFFRRAVLAGHSIVWADEALVYESVPVSRVSARWLVLRQYRNGLTRSQVMLDLERSPVRIARRALHGVQVVLQGLLAAIMGVGRGRAAMMRGVTTAALGVGLVIGLTGTGYDEYRVVHGS